MARRTIPSGPRCSGRDGGVPAAGAVHTATGVGRGAGQVEAGRRRLRRPRPAGGPEDSCWCSARCRRSGRRRPGWRRRPAGRRGLHVPGHAGRRSPAPRRSTASSHALDLTAELARPASRRGEVGVGPADSVPSGERVGSAVVIWPNSMKGAAGMPPHRQVGGDVDEAVVVDAEVDRAGPPSPRPPTTGSVGRGPS